MEFKLLNLKPWRLNKLFIGQSKPIMYIASDKNYSIIYFHDGESLRISYNLKKIEDQFKSFDQYFRVHNSYIVNREFIRRYSEDFTRVYMDGDIVLPVKNHVPQSNKGILFK